MESKVQARLEGHGGPFFPPQIDDLNHLYRHDGGWSGKELQKAARFIRGYCAKDSAVKTSDRYQWHWTLIFETNTHRIRVAFPSQTAKTGQDFARPDRSIAVYVRGKSKDVGELDPQVINYILGMLVKRFDERLRYYVPAMKAVSREP